MISQLYPHQEKGARYLSIRKRGCLFWEVGTGKTNTVISAVNSKERGKLLIAAPACVIRGMWQHYDDLPINHNVEFASYEYIARHYNEYCVKNYDYIICDECHKLKSVKAKVSKAFRRLTKKTKFCWGLTGTPYATSFLDVYGIFWSLNIDEFEMSYDSFMHTFYNCDIIYVAAGRFIYRPSKLRPGALDTLVGRIAKYADVLRTKDCVSLPELSIKEIMIDGMVTEEYLDACDGIITYAEDHQETVNKLACVQKLHQISNGFVYDAAKVPHVFCENKKLDMAKDIIEAQLEERDKIIVIYWYQYDLECLKKLLTEMRISYCTEYEDFTRSQVLLLQERRAVGVNLQDYTNYMLLYTYDWPYLDYAQAIGRIYRAGQTRACKVEVLINKGTNEVKIWKAVKHSEDIDTLFKNMMHDR